MRRFLRQNALSLVFGLLFLLALFGQSIAGRLEYNEQQLTRGRAIVSYTE